MKRLLLLLIALVSILAGFTACVDILDTAPYNKPASATMWTTENLTDMGIAGIYSNLRSLADGGYGVYSLDQYAYGGQGKSSGTLMNGTITPSNSLFGNTWKRMYEGIHRANDAIANIPLKSPVSDSKKARLVAEAKFLRAFHYYRLNELFRGVPIYLEPVTVEECIKGQDTEQAVWEQIITDLTDCIDETNLPNIDPVTGRVTKGAAYAMRGKTYLQLKEYDLAIADFAKVGECGYELFQGGYKELFTEANERCKEMIFNIQHTSDMDYAGNAQFYCGNRSSFGSCWNTFMISANGVDLHENADGTPFNWDDVIPGYNSMNIKDREVFFLRDREGAPANVVSAINTRLNALSNEAKALYLPAGNEARIRKAYISRDPRLEMNIITPYSTYLGDFGGAEQLTTSRWPMVSQDLADLWTDTRTQFHYLHRKFVYEGRNPSLPARDRCPTDEPLIRYADVLLMWAEALVERDKLAEAAEKVNKVRGRTGVNMPNVTYANKDELREKVRNERRVEFVNEGISFFDEMRWKTWKDKKFKTDNGVLQVWGTVVAPYVWLGDQLYTWPAPATEVEKNPNLTKTPGWIY